MENEQISDKTTEMHSETARKRAATGDTSKMLVSDTSINKNIQFYMNKEREEEERKSSGR